MVYQAGPTRLTVILLMRTTLDNLSSSVRAYTGCFKKTSPKSFSHYFLSYRWKSMKLQRYFGETIVNNILKSQKLPIILLGFLQSCNTRMCETISRVVEMPTI